MYSDPMEACDVYTKQCSVGVTAADLATMGATLAAGGVNPITKITRAVRRKRSSHPRRDDNGGFVYDVRRLGLQSRTAGQRVVSEAGLLAVAPGVLAISSFSPPLGSGWQ